MVGLLELTSRSARRASMQALPLDSLRTARTIVERFRVRSWRAVSRPRPALAPVITADLPWRSMPEGNGVTLGWKNGILEERVVWWIVCRFHYDYLSSLYRIWEVGYCGILSYSTTI